MTTIKIIKENEIKYLSNIFNFILFELYEIKNMDLLLIIFSTEKNNWKKIKKKNNIYITYNNQEVS